MKSLKEKLEENKKLKSEVLKIFEQSDDVVSNEPEVAAKPPGTSEEPAASPPDDNSPTSQLPAIDPNQEPIDQVISAVNIIRSGRSFKEAPVKVELDKYMKSLDDKEITALVSFLAGLSQVATGQIPGDQATDPSDAGKVKIVAADATGKKVQVKNSGQLKQVPSKEDTTAPTPIAAKKR